MLEPIAAVFGISVAELMSGNAICNRNVASNMLKSLFYVCPVCGNVIHSTGDLSVCCHGVQLMPEPAEEADDNHRILLERVEDEYYVSVEHDMTKSHFISFVAALSSEGIQMIKLYPEGAPAARVKIRGVKKIYCYCNRDGLFFIDVKKPTAR